MNSIAILSLVYTSVFRFNHAVYCDDYYTVSDCYGTVVDDTSIYCRGYGSCEDSELIASGRLQCNGEYACLDAEGITSTGGNVLGFYNCFLDICFLCIIFLFCSQIL